MDRRSFLGTLAGGVALSGTAIAATPGDEVLALLDRLTALRQRVEREARAAFDADSVGLGWYPRSTGAMAVIDSLATVPIEDQAHPAVQAFLRETYATVGEGIESAFALFSDLSSRDHAVEAERLDAALREVDAAMGVSGVSDVSRRLLGNGLGDLGARLRLDGLRGEARRAARRLGRVRSIAQRFVDEPRSRSLLAPADPSFHLRIATGTARWGLVSGRPFVFLEVLGLIACGIGILAAGYVFVVSVFCALACDAPGLLVISLLAGVVVALCIYGIVKLNRYRQRTSALPRELEADEPSEPPLALETPVAQEPVPSRSGARVTVPANVAFTEAVGFDLNPDYAWAVLATGFVVLDAEGLRLDPSGDPRVDGSSTDLLPGEPLGALVARVGSKVLLIGATALLPKGLGGPLAFAVNGPDAPRPAASGAFEVHIERLAD